MGKGDRKDDRRALQSQLIVGEAGGGAGKKEKKAKSERKEDGV